MRRHPVDQIIQSWYLFQMRNSINSIPSSDVWFFLFVLNWFSKNLSLWCYTFEIVRWSMQETISQQWISKSLFRYWRKSCLIPSQIWILDYLIILFQRLSNSCHSFWWWSLNSKRSHSFLTHVIFFIIFPKFNRRFDMKFNWLFRWLRRWGALTGSWRFEAFIIGKWYFKRINFLDLLTHQVVFNLNINSNIQSSKNQ